MDSSLVLQEVFSLKIKGGFFDIMKNAKIMKNNRRSIMISKILGAVFFIGLAVSCFFVPTFVDAVVNRYFYF